MAARSSVRDSRLIDALDALPRRAVGGLAWRVVREGRDPLDCSASGGRWDDGSFAVLYTAREREGAIAEMYFHLMRGQPIFPSRARFRLYSIAVELADVAVVGLDDLRAVGVDVGAYGQLAYSERDREYPRTQEVGEVLHFLDCGGLLAPNARFACENLMIFCDRLRPGALAVAEDHGVVDFAGWAARQGERER